MDALKLLPNMVEISNMLSSMEGKLISAPVVKYITNQSRVLREKAEIVSLLPSVEEESKGLDKRKVRSRLNKLAKSIEATKFDL